MAGHPANVSCDIPDSSALYGLSIVGGDQIHLRSSYCGLLGGSPQAAGFGEALSVLIHESSHAAGVRAESCAQTWVFTLYQAVLERFWSIAAGTPTEEEVASEIRAHAAAEPPQYTPAACSPPDPGPPVLTAPPPPVRPTEPAPAATHPTSHQKTGVSRHVPHTRRRVSHVSPRVA